MNSHSGLSSTGIFYVDISHIALATWFATQCFVASKCMRLYNLILSALSSRLMWLGVPPYFSKVSNTNTGNLQLPTFSLAEEIKIEKVCLHTLRSQ